MNNEYNQAMLEKQRIDRLTPLEAHNEWRSNRDADPKDESMYMCYLQDMLFERSLERAKVELMDSANTTESIKNALYLSGDFMSIYEICKATKLTNGKVKSVIDKLFDEGELESSNQKIPGCGVLVVYRLNIEE